MNAPIRSASRFRFGLPDALLATVWAYLQVPLVFRRTPAKKRGRIQRRDLVTAIETSWFLFSRLADFDPLPAGIAAVPERLNASAFFPAGTGLWSENPNQLLPQIMVFGQDWGTCQDFIEMRDSGRRDLDTPTWKNLLKLFSSVELDPNRCFFTNAYMGLRTEGTSVGRFAGLKFPDYLTTNDRFLITQVESFQPSAIVIMGLPALVAFSRVAPRLRLVSTTSFAQIDQQDSGFIPQVEIGAVTTNLACIVHPSFRAVNVGRRRFRGLTGNEAEKAILRLAIR